MKKRPVAKKEGAPLSKKAKKEGRPLSKTQYPKAKAADHVREIIGRGQEAWERHKAAANKSWDDWVAVGHALLIGKDESKGKGKGTCSGSKNRFSKWLQAHGFDDIDKDDRSKLINLMKDRAAIEEWRASLPEAKRHTLNHPCTVWRHYNAFLRGETPSRKEVERPAKNVTPQLVTVDPEDASEEQKTWFEDGAFIHQAHKASGLFVTWPEWQLPSPPHPKVIDTARDKVAEAQKLVAWLETAAEKFKKKKAA